MDFLFFIYVTHQCWYDPGSERTFVSLSGHTLVHIIMATVATAQALGDADTTCPNISDAAAFKAHKSPMLKNKLASFRDQLMLLELAEQAYCDRPLGICFYFVVR